jgi:hypothetical protein
MKLAAKITFLFILISTVLSCGDQKDTQVNPVADNAIVKDSSKASDSAQAQLIADTKPLPLFTYSKEKVSDDEAKFFSRFDNRSRSDVPHQKIEIDSKALVDLLQKGGILEVAIKGLDVRRFKVKPTSLNERGELFASARIEEDANGDYSTLGVGTAFLKTGAVFFAAIRILGEDFKLEVDGKGKSYFLIHIDQSKRPPQHGSDPNYVQPIGGPQIPVPPRQEPLENTPVIPGLGSGPAKKSTTSQVNIRVGVVVAKTAALELGNVGSISPKLDEAFTWLSEALSVSAANVTLSLVGNVEPVGIEDYGKPLLDLLYELNGRTIQLALPIPIRIDVASFRLKNNVDILIVVVGRYRGVPNIAAGYAFRGGNANESTIVITNEDLDGFKIAHEIGHVLGADHHPTQNQGGNTAPFYGHITPQEPVFTGLRRKADIMVDTTFFQCSGQGAILCDQEKRFSDPTLIARTGWVNSGYKSAAGCSWTLPITSSICPVNECKTYSACPYALEYGYCAGVGPGVFKPTGLLTAANAPCVPQSKLVGLWGIPQYYGVPNVSNVASLWKSPRAAEVATFRDAAKPFLYKAISTALMPALLLLL